MMMMMIITKSVILILTLSEILCISTVFAVGSSFVRYDPVLYQNGLTYR